MPRRTARHPSLCFLILQGDDSGTSTPLTKEDAAPAEAAAITADDLDFSDMKKKKKSSKKKAAFDLDAFEKELQAAPAAGGDDDDDDGPEPDGAHLDDIDEAELGDDPFAQGGDAPVGLDAGNEPWLKSDRDYTYQEVRTVSSHNDRSCAGLTK